MDIIIQYLIEKGGIFGVLFAMALSWIVFRERQLLKPPEQKSDENSKPQDTISTVASSINEIKNTLSTVKTEVDSLKVTIGEVKNTSAELKTSVVEIKSSNKKISTEVDNLKNSFNDVKTVSSEIKTSTIEVKSSYKKLSSDLSKLDSILENIQTLEKMELVNIERLEGQISSLGLKFTDIDRQIHDLWEWHSVRDSDGVFLWYVRRSLEETIFSLKSSVDNLEKKCFESNQSIFQDLDERLQKVNDERVSELKKLLETYNKTVTDLIVALEKIKMILKTKEEGE